MFFLASWLVVLIFSKVGLGQWLLKKRKGKGKQPAPREPVPQVPVPATPASSDDENGDPVNAAILQRLEALVQRKGGQVGQWASVARGKRPRLHSNQSFQAQVLASLAALEEDVGDPGMVSPAAGDVLGTPGSELPGMSSSQMMVYSGAPPPVGKSSSTVVPANWPWGPGSAAGVVGQSWQGAQQSQVPVGALSGNAAPGWPGVGGQVPPQYGMGAVPFPTQQWGGWHGWGPQGAMWSPFEATSPGAIPFRDIAMPLGEHLTLATRDRILRGEYVDVFSLLFCELEKKDKEDMDDRLKERIKRRNIDRTYANWYPGFLIYAGMIVRHQPWQALSLLQYMDLIYKTYTDFPSPAWLQYDEQFRMRAAMNPMLRWDQVHSPLWLQIMNPTRVGGGERADSGHLVKRVQAQSQVGFRAQAGQALQKCPLCWEFTSQGACSLKVCNFRHECPLCAGPHAFSSCPKPKGKSSGKDAKGWKRQSGGTTGSGEKGANSN